MEDNDDKCYIDVVKVFEVLEEVYQAILTTLAELSLKHMDIKKDREEYLKCLQTCIEKNAHRWPTVGTIFDLANPLLNKVVGKTPRAGFGNGRHATDWQHKLTKYWLPKYDPIGKTVGRYALAPTVAEGFYDFGTIGYCVFSCQHYDGSCNNLADPSCGLLHYITLMMP
ncbi:hypothetical protein [Candidatus Magnetominusculus xianensis]|uniref:Uncharacterized protein n=1 Tax=Candidatus Magnetominusculus xianensis TaxID=1748249 RepID=A0ABR5SEE3_9BACT|nr:hypothetical protein [Candidatus Magnetominusculus xianensis]KWT82912.1 hypothetical protein ASN18_2352 [Candidatus Magnetominusculus xianensis]MBF0405314.1 hypothetical protein [Nitrospirota bacterium]